ncbi:MAG TPA: DegT/DnrJ/EryC1/StrS family aminotransferase [Ignavibacteriaceae bacterium]|nr:DegT/DnrJ/EryC1/StrS family aminotransferase [Ignavibacteriaceae bacterium]
MVVPFLDLKTQYKSIKSEIDSAIQNVLDSTSFVLGKSVNDFEKEFAKQHNLKYCVALNSGTAGNHIALWSLGIEPGDEVIIPANTFIATAWGATLCGAKPVFVDCEPEGYNIDPAKVEAAITKKTKAIVAVHLYGQPANMKVLSEIAQKHNIYLVEDAAQAHIAEFENKKVGNFGIITSFSFYPGKNLGAYGEGGAIITNDEQLAIKARMLRDHGTLEKYQHKIFGHNYRMEGLQGAILSVKLKYLSDWTAKRREVAKKYNEYLKGIEFLDLPAEKPNLKHVYHLYVIQLLKGKGSNAKDVRNNLALKLKEKDIATGLHYPIPLHLQECFNHLGYKKGDFPVSENLSDACLSLPIYPEISDDQIEYVSSNILKFFNNGNI